MEFKDSNTQEKQLRPKRKKKGKKAQGKGQKKVKLVSNHPSCSIRKHRTSILN